MERFKKNTILGLQYFALIIMATVSIFPFIWMIICATNTSSDVLRQKTTLGNAALSNFVTLLKPSTGFLRGLSNTLIISGMTTLLALIICSLAGYGFVVYRSKARERLFSILLLTMMIPFSSIMIPLYRMFAAMTKVPILNLVGMNTLGAMILPSVSTAFLIFFFRQNTLSFPKDLIEAARIDGLKEIQIFCFIFLPIMRSTFAAGAIITFMNAWNNYLWPLLVGQSDHVRTLQMSLSSMGASYTSDYGALMMGVFIATIPSALLFFLMQKEFVAGMTGAVK